LGDTVYGGVLQIAAVVQMFILGPRLVLSMREYHAKLMADSDEATGMTTVDFGQGPQVSTGGDV
jgi:hypothetical protein